MSQTPEQAIYRVIDRLKDVLERGTADETKQLAELLEADDVYGALSLVEDTMQARFDQAWESDEPEADETQPAILRFPKPNGKKKKSVKG